jgi:hypothetical protein
MQLYKILGVCLFGAFLTACGVDNSNSNLDGVDNELAGVTIYRYTAKDPDPHFRLATWTHTGDENPNDDFFSFSSSVSRKFLIWGGYVSLADGGSYHAEIDYEVIGTNCRIIVDLVENEANLVREKVTLGATGRTTWRSHVIPVGAGVNNIELRVTDVHPWSAPTGFGGGRHFFPCQVKVYEKRIIHSKIM